MTVVTNQEHTHEAHSNMPMLASSPDVLPSDPYPFPGEAPAPDPRLISSLGEEPLPFPPMMHWGTFCPQGAGIRPTFLHSYKIRFETTWLDMP